MKPKTMILMVVAVGCGLAASYMTSKLLADRREVPQEEKVSLLVAKTKVPKNTMLKDPEKFFEVRQRNKDEAPRLYFTDFAQVKDKRLNRELKADVHVSPEDILEKSNTPLDVPQGYGALGLRVNAASTAGGFVWPGDKVDVILTQRGTKVTVQTILRDVLVLAVGDKPGRPDGDAGALQASTVAVALKPEDAQLVRMAESLGELSLLLRKEGDVNSQTTKVTTEDDLLRAARAVGPQPPTPPAPTEDPNKLPLVGLTLPELEAQAKKDTPKVEEPDKEPVRKPSWTLTIYPGYDPPIQQHYFDNPQGGVTRDDADPAADPKAREKKEPKKADK